MKIVACCCALLLGGAACSSPVPRGIADHRSNFEKFLPMQGDPSKYGFRAVKPFFKAARRPEILRAIETACQGSREGSSVFNPVSGGYYVNCNPRNRQLLNGYIPADPHRKPHAEAPVHD